MQSYLEDQLPVIFENLKEGMSERETLESEIANKLTEEVSAIQNRLQEERNAREEHEERML